MVVAILIAWHWLGPWIGRSVAPRGLPQGGTRSYEGLLTLSDADMLHLRFESRAQLMANERTRETGRQTSRNICVDPGAAKPALIEALARSASGLPNGAVWARFTARPYLRHSPCMQSFSNRGRRSYGVHLDVVALTEVRPLACDRLIFILDNRTCPPPPTPPKPVMLDEPKAYPDAALRRGAEGRVGVEALVGPKDELIRCRVIRTSGDTELDAAACALIARRADLRAGPGDTEGLATGVRRLTPNVRFVLNRPAPEDVKKQPPSPASAAMRRNDAEHSTGL